MPELDHQLWSPFFGGQDHNATAIHARFLEREKAGVFEALWKSRLAEYDEFEGIAWRSTTWQHQSRRSEKSNRMQTLFTDKCLVENDALLNQETPIGPTVARGHHHKSPARRRIEGKALQ
jgi:hypothetical protein